MTTDASASAVLTIAGAITRESLRKMQTLVHRTLSKSRSRPRPDERLKQVKWKVLQKRRARAKKKAFILKELGGKCSSCGTVSDLEVNHPNGGRTYTRGITSMSWEFIKKEIKGCNLLCRSENAGFNPNIRV